jgi:hypothetical protein
LLWSLIFNNSPKLVIIVCVSLQHMGILTWFGSVSGFIGLHTGLYNTPCYAHTLVCTVTLSMPLLGSGFQASNGWRSLPLDSLTVPVPQPQQLPTTSLLYTLYKSLEKTATQTLDSSLTYADCLFGTDANRVTVKVMLRWQVCLSWCQAPICGQWPDFSITPSLTRGRVCSLQLLLSLANSVVYVFESSRNNDHTLLSQIWHSPNLEGQVPAFITPRNRVAQLYPRALGYFYSNWCKLSLITPQH